MPPRAVWIDRPLVKTWWTAIGYSGRMTRKRSNGRRWLQMLHDLMIIQRWGEQLRLSMYEGRCHWICGHQQKTNGALSCICVLSRLSCSLYQLFSHCSFIQCFSLCTRFVKLLFLSILFFLTDVLQSCYVLWSCFDFLDGIFPIRGRCQCGRFRRFLFTYRRQARHKHVDGDEESGWDERWQKYCRQHHLI